MTKNSAEPLLYDIDDDGTPMLTGVRDSSGYVSYPRQDAGSLFNGDHGPALTPVRLSGRGKIQATATVRLHPVPDIETPFTIAAVVLDEGPLVRGVLDVVDSGRIGDEVVAITTVVRRGEDEIHELRFHVKKKASA
ncbi:hypothetical protein Rwratislav_29844 [Rhodococcus wratislaviensis IFP 2016]|nr:hypothetical protein Rwratislav_29844 [Rhodococcus wratislaviensis IFP 2016]